MVPSSARPLNERGNAAIVLMAALAAMVIMYTGINAFVDRLTDLNVQTTRKFAYRSALNSLLSYSRSAIKGRWCFTERWDQDSPLKCDLAHPRSVERLLLTDSQLLFIKSMIAHDKTIPHGDPLPLQKIEVSINAVDLDANHPLSPIFEGQDFSFMNSVDFKIERIDDPEMPVVGTEVHLRLEVNIRPKTGMALPDGREEFRAWNHLTVFPRELSTFSLLIGGDLYLDGSPVKRPGDVSLASVDTLTTGLNFESPVFVNHNVYLPPNTAKASTFVTFADNLVLGRGVLMQGKAPAVPVVSGVLGDQYYGKMPGFGGLQRGLKIDDVVDLGLDVLVGREKGNPPDTTLFFNCIDRNLVKYDLTKTADAALLAKTVGPGDWQFSWSRDDFFRPREHTSAGVKTQFAFYESPSVTVNGSSKRSVARVSVRFLSGGDEPAATIELTRDSVVELKPRTLKLAKDLPAGSAEQKAAKRIEAAPGTVRIETYPVVVNNRMQENQLGLRVTIVNKENILVPFNVMLMGYDAALEPRTGIANNGFSPVTIPGLRWNDANSDPLLGEPTLTNNYTAAYMRADWKPAKPGELNVNLDWQELEEKCDPSTDSGGFAFRPSNWDVSFAPSTRFSWSAKPPSAANVKFTKADSYWVPGAPPPVFQILTLSSSFKTTCTVSASANFLTGFLICDHFVIEARSTPLRIIGTVIAGSVSVDPTAIKAGIRWSNIHHPNAVMELRDAKVLKPVAAPNCDPDPNAPVWHPFPNMSMRDDRYNCNSISLRNQLDLIRWTTVDPDCGLISGGATVTCKNRPIRFVVKEIDRGFSL